jgi:hypothetical protein
LPKWYSRYDGCVVMARSGLDGYFIFLRRLYLQKVSVRMSTAGFKFHPVAMSHVRADFANVYLVRPVCFVIYRGIESFPLFSRTILLDVGG